MRWGQAPSASDLGWLGPSMTPVATSLSASTLQGDCQGSPAQLREQEV